MSTLVLLAAAIAAGAPVADDEPTYTVTVQVGGI
jgi:hypothetical protein